TADGRFGARRKGGGIAVEGVWADGLDDWVVAPASEARCRQRRRRSDDARARRVIAAAPREPQAQGRAGDPVKSRGLVRNGERDLEALFGFVKVNQATNSVWVMCRLLH